MEIEKIQKFDEGIEILDETIKEIGSMKEITINIKDIVNDISKINQNYCDGLVKIEESIELSKTNIKEIKDYIELYKQNHKKLEEFIELYKQNYNKIEKSFKNINKQIQNNTNSINNNILKTEENIQKKLKITNILIGVGITLIVIVFIILLVK